MKRPSSFIIRPTDNSDAHTDEDPPVSDSVEYASLAGHDDEGSNQGSNKELDETEVSLEPVRLIGRHELMYYDSHIVCKWQRIFGTRFMRLMRWGFEGACTLST